MCNFIKYSYVERIGNDMSFLPGSSDGIAGLMGIGALVGALTGAKPPRKGSGPGLLSMMLQESMAREQEERAARAAQDKVRMQFATQMIPAFLSAGMQIDESMFDPRVVEMMGIKLDPINKGAANIFARDMVDRNEPLFAHMGPEALADLANVKTYEDLLRGRIKYGPPFLRAKQSFDILSKQMGAPGALNVAAGWTPEQAREFYSKLALDPASVAGHVGLGAQETERRENANARGLITHKAQQEDWVNKNASELRQKEIRMRGDSVEGGKSGKLPITAQEITALNKSLAAVDDTFKKFEPPTTIVDKDELRVSSGPAYNEAVAELRAKAERERLDAFNGKARDFYNAQTKGKTLTEEQQLDLEVNIIGGALLPRVADSGYVQVMGPQGYAYNVKAAAEALSMERYKMSLGELRQKQPADHDKVVKAARRTVDAYAENPSSGGKIFIWGR